MRAFGQCSGVQVEKVKQPLLDVVMKSPDELPEENSQAGNEKPKNNEAQSDSNSAKPSDTATALQVPKAPANGKAISLEKDDVLPAIPTAAALAKKEDAAIPTASQRTVDPIPAVQPSASQGTTWAAAAASMPQPKSPQPAKAIEPARGGAVEKRVASSGIPNNSETGKDGGQVDGANPELPSQLMGRVTIVIPAAPLVRCSLAHIVS